MVRALPFVLALLLPAAAAAQLPPPPRPNARCATLAVLAGISFAEGDTGSVVGAASEWGLIPGLSLEGKASWFNDTAGADLFAATVNVITRLNAGPTQAFVKGGLGVLTASLDTGRHSPPTFYGRRLSAPDPGLRTRFSFTDPAAALGAGITVQVSRHVSLRPEVESIVAWHDARTFVATSVVVQVAYHFERHVVTPVRRR